MPKHADETIQKLQGVSSLADLCTDWQSNYRGVLVGAETILHIFLPHVAAVLEKVITLLDAFCVTQNPPPPTPAPPTP